MCSLRNAIIRDARFILSIRNDCKNQSTNGKTITWKEHRGWFKNHYKEYKILPGIGYLRKDNFGYISIALKKEYRGKGIGTRLLKAISGKAIILNNNHASIKAFVKAGFVIKGYYLER